MKPLTPLRQADEIKSRKTSYRRETQEIGINAKEITGNRSKQGSGGCNSKVLKVVEIIRTNIFIFLDSRSNGYLKGLIAISLFLMSFMYI